jgi:3-deoxy-D-manno-octulosonic-acid transferase
VYLSLLAVLWPWLLYRSVRKGKYREGYAQKLLGRVPWRRSDRACVWLHAVSVGEVNLLAPLVDEIARRRPDWECVVSTTTATGMTLARTRYPKLTVFYCPLDFSWAVAAAMRRIRPSLLVLAELELWPNLVRAARRHGAKVAIVNGRLGERSFRGYRRIRWIVARLLNRVDLLAVQNERYASRFLALGARPESVHVTGSIKFDGAQTDRDNPKTCWLRQLARVAPDDVVFLAGSTQHPEEALAVEAYRVLSPSWPKLRLILVPRHPDRFDEVAALLDKSGVPWRRRSRLAPPVVNSASIPAAADGASGATPDPPPRVLLVDTVGELGGWWGTAHVAFVGGSLSQRGGQNMIEPAAYGAAVSFGPNTWNFRDVAAEMLHREAAVEVHSGEELTAFVGRCLTDAAWANDRGRRAKDLVAQQLGATSRTAEWLDGLLPPTESTSRMFQADRTAA